MQELMAEAMAGGWRCWAVIYITGQALGVDIGRDINYITTIAAHNGT